MIIRNYVGREKWKDYLEDNRPQTTVEGPQRSTFKCKAIRYLATGNKAVNQFSVYEYPQFI
jgi:hypothetical protein